MMIAFDSEIKVIENLSEINDKVLIIQLIRSDDQDDNDVSQETSMETFSWLVTVFEPNYMIIQIEWNLPESISVGYQRDQLKVTI